MKRRRGRSVVKGTDVLVKDEWVSNDGPYYYVRSEQPARPACCDGGVNFIKNTIRVRQVTSKFLVK